MFKLNDRTKQQITKTTGIPFEKLIEMDSDEISAYVKQKHDGEMRITQSVPIASLGSGDDSVTIDSGRITTMEEIDKQIDKLAQTPKTPSLLKIFKSAKSSLDEDILEK